MVAGTAGGGVAHGDLLAAFAESVLAREPARCNTLRGELRRAVGDNGLVDAAGVIAAFDATDRIVDAVGLPLEPALLDRTAEIRDELGLDAMRTTD